MVNFFDTRIGRYIRRWKYGRIFNDLYPGEIAIDCGANVGKVTERMAKPGVTVYAFEPDPNAFGELKVHFKGKDSVHLINKAVSDHSGVAKIYFNDRYDENPKKWSTASTLLADKPHADKDNFATVEVVDLADFIKGLDKPIGLLKMDIEGEEVRVLNKLIDAEITSKIRNIVVETHERFPALTEPTRELKERIRRLKLKNIDLDWA
ncbi:MAG: FkbM family methyltransferase [bacterium]|nr:FkbM family methyltransferase [bacterium]